MFEVSALKKREYLKNERKKKEGERERALCLCNMPSKGINVMCCVRAVLCSSISEIIVEF